MKRYQIFLTILTAAVTCHCQGHFPLQVGNRWDYGSLEFFPDQSSQFVYDYTLKIISDTTMPNGELYAVLSDRSFLREVGDTVFGYSPSRGEYVAIDFSRQNGDTIYEFFPSDTQVTLVHVGSGTFFGETRTSWSFSIWAMRSSASFLVSYIDGIGRGYSEWEGGVNEYLLGAVINGKQYGTVVDVPPPTQATPGQFSLSQNYPNPFNPTTVVSGRWPVASVVRLVVYDLLGREMAVLANGPYPAGKYTFKFDGSRFASGVYFYRLTAGSYTNTRSMLLVR